HYDFIHFEASEYILPSVCGIKIYEEENVIKSAIIGSIGGGTSATQNSTIVESDKIVICCGNSVFCLLIPSLELTWKISADDATCFQIFKVNDFYIVHGELQITKIDIDGNILWQRSGEDIFTTKNGKDDFQITDEFIVVKDWNNKTYKFDFMGNLIK